MIDTYVFEQLWRMVRRRHPNKSNGWLFDKYWSAAKRHIFAFKAKTKGNPIKVYQVVKLSAIGIQRHIKIKADANPYSPEYGRYFWERRNIKGSKILPALSGREFKTMMASQR